MRIPFLHKATPLERARQRTREIREQQEVAQHRRFHQTTELMESQWGPDGVFGTPLPPDIGNLYQDIGWAGPAPFFQRDPWLWASKAVRTQQQHDIVRSLCMLQYERNGTAKGIIDQLRAFVIGQGLAWCILPNDPNDPRNDQLVKAAKECLTKFAKKVGLGTRQQDSFTRANTTGDCFVRLIPQADGPTELRFVDSDQVRCPMKENASGPWAFGIQCPPRDYETPLAYNVIWPEDSREEQLPPALLKHLKLNLLSVSMKRGIPRTFSCYGLLEQLEALRAATADGEKARQMIAYFRQFRQADKATIENLNAAEINDHFEVFTPMGHQTQVPMARELPGQRVDIGEGLEVKPPPVGDVENAVFAIEALAQGIAVAMGVPVWIVLGAMDHASFASSLTEQSPFVQRIAQEQDIYATYWASILEAILEIEAAQHDALPPDILEYVSVHVEGMSVAIRDKKAETERHAILLDLHLMSPQEASTEEGLDFAEQQKLWKEAEDAGFEQAQNPAGEGDEGPEGNTEKGEAGPQTSGGERQRDEK